MSLAIFRRLPLIRAHKPVASKCFGTLSSLYSKSGSSNEGVSEPTGGFRRTVDLHEFVKDQYMIPGKFLHFFQDRKRPRTMRESKTEDTVKKVGSKRSGFKKIEVEYSDTLRKQIANTIRKATLKAMATSKVPHQYLHSVNWDLVEVSLSDDLKKAKIWWRPAIPDGENIDEEMMEELFQAYERPLCSMVYRHLPMRKPPIISFVKEDAYKDETERLLEKIAKETSN
ncbi:hypothetical protein K493DRAFT_335415 [Basidiobolus meristosporus CBS 931.73]|uniref:Uncharacterized protein n=1 Tax=Basidiobolus meristosporus CBS 931.73 TaxID=1314790 RepID=A0A1Y1YRA2_9FUNG|nr:hypothetical protein K493DRAFT_335415 [Basidiobolus meristosporus CBS 931.73]|eukprot:ORY00277.1 hypothetical protein K493DRAFT_335415 [Basidiobolus meristosporus CBS 931.73]